MKKKKEKKYPIRTCIACRKKTQKRDMVRIVKTQDGKALIDKSGKIRGRGANLCEDVQCFQKVLKKGLIEKALNLKRKLTEKEAETLLKDFEQILYEREFRKGKKPVSFRINKEDLERINKSNGKTGEEKN